VRDGKEVTRCAASRSSTNSICLLADIEADNPTGEIFLITDALSSHNSAQLNRRANPWIWGRPTRDHRHYRRLLCYRL
jgi:hypothetical protein